eukprot:1216111-Rhodomonas_salina.1
MVLAKQRVFPLSHQERDPSERGLPSLPGHSGPGELSPLHCRHRRLRRLLGKRQVVGDWCLPSSPQTLNNSNAKNKPPSSLAPVSLILGPIASRQLLSVHALSKSIASSVLSALD